MITEEKEIMKIGKEFAKILKEHFIECGNKCDFCETINDTVDVETTKITKSDSICAFWEFVTHQSECWEYKDHYSGANCNGCKLVDELFTKYPNAKVPTNESRLYELHTLAPIRRKIWKKEGVVD